MAFRRILSHLTGITNRIVTSSINLNVSVPIYRQMSTDLRGRFCTRPVKVMESLNRPARQYRPEEEDIYNLPDPEVQVWKEQRSLYNLALKGPRIRRKRVCPIDKRPQMKGIVLRTLIRKPRKPNSANRKCVLVRLSNGRETVVFVPGIGHNLQEHSRVLVHKHRVKDVPGLKLRVIRGVYDCSKIIKQSK